MCETILRLIFVDNTFDNNDVPAFSKEERMNLRNKPDFTDLIYSSLFCKLILTAQNNK